MHPPGSNVGLPPKRYLYDKADCPHDEARDDRAHPPLDSGSFLLESAPPLDLNARPETLLPNQEQAEGNEGQLADDDLGNRRGQWDRPWANHPGCGSAD